MLTKKSNQKNVLKRIGTFFLGVFKDLSEKGTRVTQEKLDKVYGVSKHDLESIRAGDDMKFTHMLRVMRAYLFQFKSIEDKVNHLIEVLDVVRDQDVDNYGPEGSPFGMSIKDAIQYMIYTKALELIKFNTEEQIKKKRHDLLVKNQQITD